MAEYFSEQLRSYTLHEFTIVNSIFTFFAIYVDGYSSLMGTVKKSIY